LVSKGITTHTYTDRAELIISLLLLLFIIIPVLETFEYNIFFVKCETTPKTICKAMFREFPSIIERSSCLNEKCEKFQETYQPIYIITYNTTNGIISDLQEFINNQFQSEQTVFNYTNKMKKSQCSSQRMTRFEVSPLYLLIEILFWSGM
jgi:hypothetical protein